MAHDLRDPLSFRRLWEAGRGEFPTGRSDLHHRITFPLNPPAPDSPIRLLLTLAHNGLLLKSLPLPRTPHHRHGDVHLRCPTLQTHLPHHRPKR